MTDTRLAEAKEAVVRASDRYSEAMSRKMDADSEHFEAKRAYEAAKEAVEKAAEIEREKKPRLKNAAEVWNEAKGAGHPEGWRAVSRKTRDVVLADVIEKAEKLPRVSKTPWRVIPGPEGEVDLGECIKLSDLKALAESAK